MAEKRVLHYASGLLTAFRVSPHSAEIEGRFVDGEDGLAAFESYLHGIPRSLVYFLADVVEEDFQQDLVPLVRGSDRRALLERRLAQRYRDTSFSMVVPLGVERGERRNERLLLAALTNPEQIQPWLDVVAKTDLPLVGVFSVPQLASKLAARLVPKNDAGIVVSLGGAGLRQSYVENGKLLFSRLKPVPLETLRSPTVIADEFLRETIILQQYLESTRWFTREEAPALLIAPAGHKAAIETASADIGLRVVDIDDAAKAIGLRQRPLDAGAEILYVYLVAIDRPSVQYAKEGSRGQFRLYQVRNGILALGGAVGAVCVLVAGYQWFEVWQTRERTMEARASVTDAMNQYARITAGFPPVPTKPENLRTAMQQYAALTRETMAPDGLLAEVSVALGHAPRIEIEGIRWASGRGDAGSDGRDRAGTAVAAPANAETVEISGRVREAKGSEYRMITDTVNDFIGELAKRPGLAVLGSKLPFEIGSDTSLSGDIGAGTGGDPRFSVTVVRKAQR